MWKRWSAAWMVLAVLMTAAGCGGKKESEPEKEPEPVYPVSIDGAEILIGETTVQTLLDQGLSITVSESSPDMKEITQYEVDPELELEANSYYSGGSIWITEHCFAHIAIVTDEEAVKMGDAVIGYMEFSLVSAEDETLDKLMFNGVPISELNREKAGEMFPDFSGDENMWFSTSVLKDYEYFMGFDTAGNMIKLSVEKNYDVDWNNKP